MLCRVDLDAASMCKCNLTLHVGLCLFTNRIYTQYEFIVTYSMFAQLMQCTYEGNNNIHRECLVSLSCIINSQSQHVLCLWRLLTACNHEANSNPLKHWHCFDSYDHVNDVPECYLLSVMLLALWPWLLHVLWLSEPLFFNTRRHKYCHAMLDFL